MAKDVVSAKPSGWDGLIATMQADIGVRPPINLTLNLNPLSLTALAFNRDGDMFVIDTARGALGK